MTHPSNTSSGESDERAAFEAWTDSEWGTRVAPHNAWLGWQARAALATQPAAPAEVVADLRPEVLAFARVMETKLRKHDHKPGWKGDRPEALRMRIYDEWKELTAALRENPESPERIRSEAADVANFAMMIADNWGGLTDQPIKVPQVDLDGILEAMVESTDCSVHDGEYRLDGAELMGLLRRAAALAPPAQAPSAPSVGEPVAKHRVMQAASQAFGYEGGLQSINQGDLERFAEELTKPKRDWRIVDRAIQQYLNMYELRGEDENGADADHTPTDFERYLLEDAINGLLADQDFTAAYFATSPAAPAATEAPRKPFAYYIHIAAEQRAEFVYNLDEALDDLTNYECKITELFDHATPAPAVGASDWQAKRELMDRLDARDAGASVQPVPASLSDEQRVHLDQAADMLDSYGCDQRKLGNDSTGEGAAASAYVLRQMLASSTPTKGGEAS